MPQKKVTHPSYPNPAIVEAVCEIHFAYPTDDQWRASVQGDFFKLFQDDYPQMEPRLDVAIEIETGPRGVTQKLQPVRQRISLKHATRPLTLQLYAGVLTINVRSPYPGWENMRTDVLDVWRRSLEVLEPSSIHRIGLRYINHILREEEGDCPKKWLRPADYIPEGILTSHPGFLSRSIVQLDSENRVIVTVTDTKDSSGEHGAIVLDIDRITEKEMEPTAALGDEIERLHEDVWKIFSDVKTKRLESVLGQEKK